MGVRKWLLPATALAIAAFAIVSPPFLVLAGQRIGAEILYSLSLLLSIIWCVLVGVALVRSWKAGIWLVLGAPFALFWPTLLCFVIFASDRAKGTL